MNLSDLTPAKNVVVLVPAYNAEDTIAETLESIQGQGPHLARVHSVVLADDGSTDRTVAVGRSCWKHSTPLTILEAPKNRGEYINVNEAVASLARAIEWFVIMHADNVVKENWLETFLRYIAAAGDDVGTICASYDWIGLDGRIVPGENKRGIVSVRGTRESVNGSLKQGCWWHNGVSAVRIASFQAIGGHSQDIPVLSALGPLASFWRRPGKPTRMMRIKGDWDLMVRFLRNGWTIEYVPQSVVLYKDNPKGVSSITFRHHWDIRETVQVIERHQYALSSPELIRLHGDCIVTLLRRMAKSAGTFDFDRLLWALPAQVVVVSTLTRILRGRLWGALTSSPNLSDSGLEH